MGAPTVLAASPQTGREGAKLERSKIAVSDYEIYGIARLLIHLHGEHAEQEVARFTDLMRAEDTPAEQQLWQRIKTAIVEISVARRALSDQRSPKNRAGL